MQSLATSIGLALFGVAVRRSPAPLRLAAIVASAGLAYDALTHRKRGPFDQTLSLMREPYRFIGAECRRRGVSTFETRVMLERTVCMRGAQAASLFYDGTRMRREGAAPEPLRATLFGNGGVQTLDDYAHRHRKALFLAVTTPERVAALARRANVEWEHAIDRWTTRRSIALYPEVQAVLARAVCAWAGVPLDVDGIKARTAQFAALFDDAARGAIEHLHARYARKRLEHWLARLIDDHREGRARFPHGTVAEDVARHTDGYGDPLPAHIAAVELLNILRPTVAVSVYVTFVAHALATRPTCRARLAEGDPRYLDAFVQEVRRWYPFFPSAMARATRLRLERTRLRGG